MRIEELQAAEEARKQDTERQVQEWTEEFRQAYSEKGGLATVMIPGVTIPGNVPSGVVARAAEKFQAERDGIGAPVTVRICSHPVGRGVYTLIVRFE